MEAKKVSESGILNHLHTLEGYEEQHFKLTRIEYQEPTPDEDGITDNWIMIFRFDRECLHCHRLTTGEMRCTLKTAWKQFERKFKAAFVPKEQVLTGQFCMPGSVCWRLRGKGVQTSHIQNSILLPPKLADYLRRWEVSRSIEKCEEKDLRFNTIVWRLPEEREVMTAADLVVGLIERWITERELVIDEHRRKMLVKKLVRDRLEGLVVADGVEDAERNWLESMGEAEEWEARLQKKALWELQAIERLIEEGFPEFRNK